MSTRDKACQESESSSAHFQWKTCLIVKCMAWLWCGRGNEWPGGRWLSRHSKHVLKNADLSFTFYSLAPFSPLCKSPFLTKSGMFVAPTLLVMEHFEKTMHVCCQRVFVCRMKSLLPLPPRPITLDLTLWKCQRAAESRRASLIGPFLQQGPRQGFSVESGSLSVRPPLQARVKQIGNRLFHTNIHKDVQFCCEDVCYSSCTCKCVKKEHFSWAYPFFSFPVITLSQHKNISPAFDYYSCVIELQIMFLYQLKLTLKISLSFLLIFSQKWWMTFCFYPGLWVSKSSFAHAHTVYFYITKVL